MGPDRKLTSFICWAIMKLTCQMRRVCTFIPQGLSEEEIQEAAKAAAAEAAASSSLVQSSKADGGDAQSRYYNLAHRSALHPLPVFRSCGSTSCCKHSLIYTRTGKMWKAC